MLYAGGGAMLAPPRYPNARALVRAGNAAFAATSGEVPPGRTKAGTRFGKGKFVEMLGSAGAMDAFLREQRLGGGGGGNDGGGDGGGGGSVPTLVNLCCLRVARQAAEAWIAAERDEAVGEATFQVEVDLPELEDDEEEAENGDDDGGGGGDGGGNDVTSDRTEECGGGCDGGGSAAVEMVGPAARSGVRVVALAALLPGLPPELAGRVAVLYDEVRLLALERDRALAPLFDRQSREGLVFCNTEGGFPLATHL